MLKKFSVLMFSAAMMLSYSSAHAGSFSVMKKPNRAPVAAPAPAPAAKPATPVDDKAPKPYKDVITKDAKSLPGFLTIHQIKDKYFFEFPDSVLGRDILTVSRIVSASTSPRSKYATYVGDYAGEDVIRFEVGPNNKLFMREIFYAVRSAENSEMYQSVVNSNLQPIKGVFDIKAIKTDSTTKRRSYVVDMTEYIKADKSIFSLGEEFKKDRGMAPMGGDVNYITSVKAFPINIEVRTMRSYNAINPPLMTFEVNASIVLLPKEPMKPRIADARVGYFALNYLDFDSNPQGVETNSIITRWRMEPKDADIEKYKRGELVEPKKPIVIYIDPATPKKWVPYLIQGVNDWQKAFEKAGFKNAIYALEAPVNDPTWSLEDATHSAIVYKASDTPNASGPHIHDPRSGEIIETHINWYHNIMELLRNWYTIQAGPYDERGRHPQFDDELMGQLIRFVSSHEVGHTLGLRHNFGSSATVPVEKLRDKAWVEANGHTPSIMDYARFNYVAQPEDNIGPAGVFPRIGIYDEWSIEWGYRWLPQFKTPEDEKAFNNKDIIDHLKKDIRYTFGGESDPADPRNQSEALGDNPMKAGEYGIKNLKRIVPNVLDWTKEPNEGYDKAKRLYMEVVNQYWRYLSHATTCIGGIYTTPRAVEETGASMEHVPASIQREAVAFLNKQIFTTPTWMIDKNLIRCTGVNPQNDINNIQGKILEAIFKVRVIERMTFNERLNGSSAYTVQELFTDLRKGIFSELYTGKAPDEYRRILQRTYVSTISQMVERNPNQVSAPVQTGPGSTATPSVRQTNTDAHILARAELNTLYPLVKAAAASSTGVTKAFYQNLAVQIGGLLDMK